MRLQDIDQQIAQIKERLARLAIVELEAVKLRDRAQLDAAWVEYDAQRSKLRELEHRRSVDQAAHDQEPAVDHQLLATIANRWRGYEAWCAPARNPMWIEKSGGQPIAAVTCTAQELVRGELERRRQALAHAPDDIKTLLELTNQLELRCESLAHALLGTLDPGEDSSLDSPAPLRAVA